MSNLNMIRMHVSKESEGEGGGYRQLAVQVPPTGSVGDLTSRRSGPTP